MAAIDKFEVLIKIYVVPDRLAKKKVSGNEQTIYETNWIIWKCHEKTTVFRGRDSTKQPRRDTSNDVERKFMRSLSGNLSRG